ncbi:alanine--tRNA ligase-related protein [Serratia inhibens]|uniref:Alanyl-tRNA editing protein n=1 Tax=Serratia inhibens TaxID=2338073 RepID=A0AA93BYN6_9GAMM|nr:alanyl-tRNA editing protein [Serratia inhibens]ANS42851.1 Alanine--tRNA ligase [Serratia inhibens PRI-2C]RJF58873.1 alanyl-tRNA editing protein [Serratia inhibens]
MLTTKRLFDEKPYEHEFQARITFIGDEYIVLDQTLFYPLSGNQDYDIGFIEGREVTAVQVDTTEEGRLDFSASVKHYLNVDGFAVGQLINGKIDRARRLNTMRLHTASHLVEYFLSRSPDFLSVEGSFVNCLKDRTDYLLAKNLDPSSLSVLELEVNDFIRQGHPVKFEFQDDLRIWCCAGIRMACCGTHVSNTGEIGQVKLSRKNKGKGLNRIEAQLL